MLPDPSPTVTVDGLLLRPLRAADEIAAREADAELHREGFDFLMAGTRSFPAAAPVGAVDDDGASDRRTESRDSWARSTARR